jgi:hypothetical protein
MIHFMFYISQLMICNGCLLNLEIICLKFCGNKTNSLLFSSQVFINWNDLIEDIMEWTKIYVLLVELTFVLHFKCIF